LFFRQTGNAAGGDGFDSLDSYPQRIADASDRTTRQLQPILGRQIERGTRYSVVEHTASLAAVPKRASQHPASNAADLTATAVDTM